MKPNRYCGPFAVSYLLGVDTGEAARRIRMATGRRAIRGVRHGELLTTLRRGGMVPIDEGWESHRPTLARWLGRHRGGLYVVAVTGHYVVIDGWRIYDNTHPAGTARRRWPHRRKRVNRWWRFR